MNDYNDFDFNRYGYYDHDIDDNGWDINHETWKNYLLRCIINLLPINYHCFAIGQYFIAIKKVKHLNIKHRLVKETVISNSAIFGSMVLSLFFVYFVVTSLVIKYDESDNHNKQNNDYLNIFLVSLITLCYNYFGAVKWSIVIGKYFSFIGTNHMGPTERKVSNGASTRAKQAGCDEIYKHEQMLCKQKESL